MQRTMDCIRIRGHIHNRMMLALLDAIQDQEELEPPRPFPSRWRVESAKSARSDRLLAI
jgi:hypothetical protein